MLYGTWDMECIDKMIEQNGYNGFDPLTLEIALNSPLLRIRGGLPSRVNPVGEMIESGPSPQLPDPKDE